MSENFHPQKKKAGLAGMQKVWLYGCGANVAPVLNLTITTLILRYLYQFWARNFRRSKFCTTKQLTNSYKRQTISAKHFYEFRTCGSQYCLFDPNVLTTLKNILWIHSFLKHEKLTKHFLVLNFFYLSSTFNFSRQF